MSRQSSISFFSSNAFLSIFLCILSLWLPFVLQAQLWAQGVEQTQVFPTDKTITEMTPEELERYYPSEFRHVEFSANQDQLGSLLAKTGERVQAFFQDFSDTSSKEYVLMQRLGYNGNVDKSDSRNFNYMILYQTDNRKPSLKEYRTDKKYAAIAQDAIQGFIITSGYACLSLNFHPSYQQGSRFRYLGRQTSDSRAYLIAFAQTIEANDLMIGYTDTITGKSVRLPVQGIAWVDPNTYQILRLRINLQAGENQSPLTEQITDIQFSEARFGDIQKQLWMPREVVVTTTMANYVFRNYHRYSDYKLFATSSDFTIEKPKSGK